MALVGRDEREAAAASLRRHYVSERLSLEELGERLQLALRARTRGDLRRALAGLPPVWRDVAELRRVGALAKRGAIRAVLALLWLSVSGVLLLALAVTAIVHGLTGTDAIVFLVAWAAVTLLAWRLGRRA